MGFQKPLVLGGEREGHLGKKKKEGGREIPRFEVTSLKERLKTDA